MDFNYISYYDRTLELHDLLFFLCQCLINPLYKIICNLLNLIKTLFSFILGYFFSFLCFFNMIVCVFPYLSYSYSIILSAFTYIFHKLPSSLLSKMRYCNPYYLPIVRRVNAEIRLPNCFLYACDSSYIPRLN